MATHPPAEEGGSRREGEEIKGRMFGGLTSLREGYLPSLDPHPLPKKGNKMGRKEKGGGRMVGFHAEAGSSRPLVPGLFLW